MLERIIRAFLLKKAAPVITIKPDKIPFELQDRKTKDKSYWKFHEEHETELNTDEHGALRFYTGSGYNLINTYLRSDDPESDPPLLGHYLKHLDRAVAKGKVWRNIVLWRKLSWDDKEPLCAKLSTLGISSRGRSLNGLDQKVLSSIVGFKFTEPGFSSASLIPLLGGVIQLKIILEKGQGGLMVNSVYGFDNKYKEHNLSLTQFPQEHEFILPRSTKFEVVSSSITTRSTLVVEVRVID